MDNNPIGPMIARYNLQELELLRGKELTSAAMIRLEVIQAKAESVYAKAKAVHKRVVTDLSILKTLGDDQLQDAIDMQLINGIERREVRNAEERLHETIRVSQQRMNMLLHMPSPSAMSIEETTYANGRIHAGITSACSGGSCVLLQQLFSCFTHINQTIDLSVCVNGGSVVVAATTEQSEALTRIIKMPIPAAVICMQGQGIRAISLFVGKQLHVLELAQSKESPLDFKSVASYIGVTDGLRTTHVSCQDRQDDQVDIFMRYLFRIDTDRDGTPNESEREYLLLRTYCNP